MPYNNIISRTDVAALIPEQVSNAMLTGIQDSSAALSMFPRIQVAATQTRFPIIAALPNAYFVNGDTGLKQTTEVNWANRFLNIEELAAIVPIPENVIDDANFDVWGNTRPLLEQAIGRALDAAIFFGVNKPASWPTDLVAAATASGNTVARGTADAAAGGIAEDFNQLFGKVEADGYGINGIASRTSFKAVVRGVRDTIGQPLADMANGTIWGERVRYVGPGNWPASGTGAAEAIAGDFNQGIIGIRQDFNYKILDQAVITDNLGAIVYNLPQQDMVALRVTFRVGFQVATPLNYENSANATRFPFAVLTQP